MSEARRDAQLSLQALEIEGFKSLKNATRVELGQLTVLAGANNSGKSSLMQPLLLMKQTLEAPYGAAPLLLAGPNVIFSDVRQMFWYAAGTSRRKDFRVCLELPGKRSVEVVFERVSGERKAAPETLGIARCTWRAGEQQLDLYPDMDSQQLKEAAAVAPQVLTDWSSPPENLQPKLKPVVVGFGFFLVLGFALEEEKELFLPAPGPWLEMDSILKGIIHVPGLRGNPARTYHRSTVGPTFPGLFQDYVASVIARWQQQKRSAQIKQLGQDLQSLGLTWKVEAHPVSATEVELRVGRLKGGHRGGARDMVSIADVGFGVSQTLPVVVALLAAQPGQLVYLEQPEIHLHPRAQQALAELLMRAVNRGVQVVVETHSELLLLGIQRLVAEAQLSATTVKLHWFERDEEGVTHVSSAQMDEMGAFGDWPVDFAETSMEAMRAYLDATVRR